MFELLQHVNNLSYRFLFLLNIKHMHSCNTMTYLRNNLFFVIDVNIRCSYSVHLIPVLYNNITVGKVLQTSIAYNFRTKQVMNLIQAPVYSVLQQLSFGIPF